MRHLRIWGLCLAALFAVAAIASTSAVAKTPEWGKCEAKAGGKFKDSNCTEAAKKGTGAFEWHKGASLPNVPFTGAGGASVLNTFLRACKGNSHGFEEGSEVEIGEGSERTRKCEEGGVEEAGLIEIECEAEHATGEASGKDLIKKVGVAFSGCKALGVVPCQNEGGTEGTVNTNELKGSLGYISKSTTPVQVGVLLEPAKKKGHFADFECGPPGVPFLQTRVGVGNFKKEGCAYHESKKCGDDGILSPIVPVDEMTSTYTQEYTTNTEGENFPTNLEGKGRSSLEAYIDATAAPKNSSLWSRAGEVVKDVNTPSEPGEIKA